MKLYNNRMITKKVNYYMLVYIFIQSFFFTIVEGKKMKISKLIYDIKKDKEKFGLLIENLTH